MKKLCIYKFFPIVSFAQVYRRAVRWKLTRPGPTLRAAPLSATRAGPSGDAPGTSRRCCYHHGNGCTGAEGRAGPTGRGCGGAADRPGPAGRGGTAIAAALLAGHFHLYQAGEGSNGSMAFLVYGTICFSHLEIFQNIQTIYHQKKMYNFTYIRSIQTK
jgi:hypothetical protein